jgi:MFS family permease
VQSQVTPTLSPRAELRATTLVYLAGFTYHIGLSGTLLLVPLYALHLGFALDELGIIIASQAVFGLFLRLFAGAISDRFGERWVLLVSFAATIVGAAVIGLSSTFWPLILGQTFLGISRATYWTATQSYCSRINPAKSGTVLGRMSSSRTAGDVIGAVFVGFIIGSSGYASAWMTIIALGVIGLVGSLALPVLPRKIALRGFKQALAPIPSLARSPSMAMAGFTAFVASASMIIAVSLLVLYLHELGYDEFEVGRLRTYGSIGSVGIGIIFGRIVARTGQTTLYTLTLAATGVVMFAFPIVGSAMPIVLMLSYGILYGILSPLYPLTASTYSPQDQRGVAMAYVGLYWAVAQVAVPLSFGFIAANVGLRDSFWFAGLMFIGFAVAMPILFRLLTKSHMPFTSEESSTRV